MATWYNDETESEMVEMWRSEPLLYTTTSKGCSHRHKKNAASYKIAEYFRTTVDDINKRMTSLRTQYSRIIKPPKSGSAKKRTTRRQEWILKNLDFLKPFIRKRHACKSGMVIKLEDDDNGFGDGESDDKGDHADMKWVVTENYDNQPQKGNKRKTSDSGKSSGEEGSQEYSDSGDLDPTRDSTNETARSLRHCKSPKRVTDATEDYRLIVIRKSVDDVIAPDLQDEVAVFVKHLAVKLRKITDSRTMLVVQNEIEQAVFRANMGMYGPGCTDLNTTHPCSNTIDKSKLV